MWSFRLIIFKPIVVIDGRGISCETALCWISLDFIDDKSTLVQVMAWCHQATSHYLSQCWLRSMSPYGVTRPQWVKQWRYYSLAIICWLKSSYNSVTQCGLVMPGTNELYIFMSLKKYLFYFLPYLQISSYLGRPSLATAVTSANKTPIQIIPSGNNPQVSEKFLIDWLIRSGDNA